MRYTVCDDCLKMIVLFRGSRLIICVNVRKRGKVCWCQEAAISVGLWTPLGVNCLNYAESIRRAISDRDVSTNWAKRASALISQRTLEKHSIIAKNANKKKKTSLNNHFIFKHRYVNEVEIILKTRHCKKLFYF